MYKKSLPFLIVLIILSVSFGTANSYYDPQTGRFITQDPYLGEKSTPPSLHRYTYAYSNPTVYIDPTGEATQSQFEDIITTARDAWIENGNKTASGRAGEAILENVLEKSGNIIIKGPVNNPGPHNADIIAYDPETKRMLFIDNKVQGYKKTVSKVGNLSTSPGREKSIEEAMKKLNALDLPAKQKDEIKRALDNVENNFGKADWLVGNATHDEITNLVKRISVRLAKKGVRMLDVVGDKYTIKSLEESIEGVRGSKKFLERMGKALPIIGAGASIILGSIDVQKAMAEDFEYQETMKKLGMDPEFPHQSTKRQLAIIAGEEAAGEAAGAGGAFVGAFAGPWTAVGGGIAGGLAGDYAGGKYAAWQFDKSVELNDEQRKKLWHQPFSKYKNRNNNGPLLTVEGGSSPEGYILVPLD